MEDWIADAPPVPEIAAPTTTAAFEALLDTARPTFIRGLVSHWPGSRRRASGARRLPPICGGRSRSARALCQIEHGDGAFSELDERPNSAAADRSGECALVDRYASRVSAHFDMACNVAVVVAGCRRVVLFPPEQAANLYVGPLDMTMAGQPTSMVDLERPDLARYPRFAAAQAAALVAHLEPGDAIVIPTMWWHEIRASGSLNVLVNYRWTRGTPDAPFAALIHAILAVRDRSRSSHARNRQCCQPTISS